jgi:hypothetical protein
MTFQTLVCALLLALIGSVGYFTADLNDKGERPITALIPLWFGLALAACAVLVLWKESLRKHVMHTAAMIGLLGLIGGFVPMIRQNSKGLPFDPTAPAVRNGLMMSAVCLLFVGLCVMSFIAARKARGEQKVSAP